jgi:hypothetical protein
MLTSLAIAALGFAVANDEGGEASLEERFRILYALGDKSAAYKLLFAEKGHIADARRDALKPLLLKLTEQMQGEKTLEGLKAVLEEIEAVLFGWSSWKPVLHYGAGIFFIDVATREERTLVPGRKETHRWTGERRSPGYHPLAWGVDASSPSSPADIPIFIDLSDFVAAWAKGDRGIEQVMKTDTRLIGWDKDGRVLMKRSVMETEEQALLKFDIRSFEAWRSEPF